MNGFRITWEDVSCGWDSRPLTTKQNGVIKGLSTYPTVQAAQNQIMWFSLWFPFNKYSIISAT